jgi:MoxR-like ATPase
MTWQLAYEGTGTPRDVKLPPPPPWRTFPRQQPGNVFQPTPALIEAVNAALFLRRPLLITGAPGSGKSTVIDSVATELKLGRVLRWHVTSRSTLADALYQYDVLGRIHAQQLAGAASRAAIEPFLRLGPLGTALLPGNRPRALVIDEIDKSDLDLPSDLLDVLESGAFEIPELIRLGPGSVTIREWDSEQGQLVTNGVVECREFPFIVMTSNGERDFPAPFLRRCIRFHMPRPTAELLQLIVGAHLGEELAERPDTQELIVDFVSKVLAGENLAVDQLLNAAHLLSSVDPSDDRYERLHELLVRELSGA